MKENIPSVKSKETEGEHSLSETINNVARKEDCMVGERIKKRRNEKEEKEMKRKGTRDLHLNREGDLIVCDWLSGQSVDL